MVIKSSSPTRFFVEYPGQEGIKTPDGKRWPGQGYSGTGFVAANEAVSYKDVDGIRVTGTVPLWSLYAKRFSVKKAQSQTGEANLKLDSHPGQNANNLQLVLQSDGFR